MHITVLGHASVLIDTGATRLLVDPVFADHVASGSVGFHPARTIDTGALPAIDAVAISHSHLDHWHAPTVQQFDRGTPMIVPDDRWLRQRLNELGFTDLRVVRPWEAIELGDLHLLPTPSDTDVEEYGLVAAHGDVRYWHVSDCFVRRADAEAITDRLGPVTVAAARYQPGNALVSYQRNLGWAHDERVETAEWLEAVCATDPVLVFPYFWGVAYVGEHAWANRYVAPYTPTMIASLLRRRLDGRAAVTEVRPGDVIEARARDAVAIRRDAAGWVRPAPSSAPSWEPVDTTTLAGIDPTRRPELRERLEGWFARRFAPWLAAALGDPEDPVQALVAWNVRWQVVVHVGDGQRLAYHADFGRDRTLLAGPDADADLTVHLGGRALLDVLTGSAGTELLWLAGQARTHERILPLLDGRISAPPLRGWDLAETVPEPLTWCLRSLPT